MVSFMQRDPGDKPCPVLGPTLVIIVRAYCTLNIFCDSLPQRASYSIQEDNRVTEVKAVHNKVCLLSKMIIFRRQKWNV